MEWIKVRAEKFERFRVGLHPEYKVIYDQLEKLLPPAWAPFFGFRTIEEQAKLFSKGRTKASIERGEKIVTNAAAGLSMHNYGMASDITIWDLHARPVWVHNEWQVYADAVKKAGGEWAGNWISFRELIHNQYPCAVAKRAINEIRLLNGLVAAQDFIVKNRRTI